MMKSKCIIFTIILFVITFFSACITQTTDYKFKITGMNIDFYNIPVKCKIQLRGQYAKLTPDEISIELTNIDNNQTVPGQIILDEDGNYELWWVIPVLKTYSTDTWIASLSKKVESFPNEFLWEDHIDNYLDLLYNGRKISRFIYGYDTTSDQRFIETYKPFLHIFDEDGKHLITEGPDGNNKFEENRILYPHHRGVFFGWPLKCDGENYSYWGMNRNEKLVCAVTQKFLELDDGPVLARSKALINWGDKNGEPIITEERTISYYSPDSASIICFDFESALKSVKGEIKLEGNPDHGGFHFRAHNDIAVAEHGWRYLLLIDEKYRETKEELDKRGGAKAASFIFPADSIVPHLRQPVTERVKERNLLSLKNYPDMPWVAMTFVLRGKNYTVQIMNHPTNPSPTEYSAYRGYGRFGAWFERTIPKGITLTVKYRVYISSGQTPSRKQLERNYLQYISSPDIQLEQ